ncbi:unnamed protein product, partial [Arabidopsis halleri]
GNVCECFFFFFFWDHKLWFLSFRCLIGAKSFANRFVEVIGSCSCCSGVSESIWEAIIIC